MHAPRLLFAVLLIAAVALPSARGGVSLVFDITDSDPLSSQQLADALVANYASYGLGITNVTVLGDASLVGVPPLGSLPPTGSPPPTSPSTGSPSAGAAKAPKSSAYLDWAPALIVCVVAAALGVALVVYAIVRRKNKAGPTGQQTMTLALCVMLLCGPHSAHSLSRSYANCRILLPGIDYRVYWNINGNNLEVALQGQSQGWLGLGISTSTQSGSLMDSAGEPPYGSDITVGYVGGDCPNGCAFDYWSTLHERPNLDTAQNVTFVAGAKNATHMTVEYNRPLATRGDADQDKSIPTNAPVMVIFAANVDESPTAQGTQFSYHGSNRNGMRINFGAASNCDRAYVNLRIQMTLSSPFATFDVGTFFSDLGAKLNVGAERFQFIASDDNSFSCPSCIIDEWLMPNYPVLGSAGVTQFVCHDFAFDVDNTYHAIRFDPIIPASSESIAHHMILYSLGAPTGKTGFWECSNMPSSAAPLSVWAVGATSFILPDNVGFPVGKDKTVYATIQMHYNNPALRDFIDASGFRIFRTPVLRPLNGGWAFLGSGLGKINIPAGIPYPPGALVSGNCPATLVNYWTTYGDVHVFAYAMHAHTLARKIQTDHWRGGQRVSMLSNDPYSFSFQHLVMGDWVIKQGDSLNTTCWYDSSSRTVATRGGETSSNEMCFAIVAFYCPDPCPSTFSGGACIV